MPAKKLPEDRNLKLLKKAKAEGYFIRCIYVLTCDSNINVARVKSRESQGDMVFLKTK